MNASSFPAPAKAAASDSATRPRFGSGSRSSASWRARGSPQTVGGRASMNFLAARTRSGRSGSGRSPPAA